MATTSLPKIAKPYLQPNNSIRHAYMDHIDKIAKYGSVAVTGSICLSMVYTYSYLWYLNIPFSSIPLSISDFAVIALYWLPVFIFMMSSVLTDILVAAFPTIAPVSNPSTNVLPEKFRIGTAVTLFLISALALVALFAFLLISIFPNIYAIASNIFSRIYKTSVYVQIFLLLFGIFSAVKLSKHTSFRDRDIKNVMVWAVIFFSCLSAQSGINSAKLAINASENDFIVTDDEKFSAHIAMTISEGYLVTRSGYVLYLSKDSVKLINYGNKTNMNRVTRCKKYGGCNEGGVGNNSRE